MYDLLIRGGMVIDGTGSAAYRADVAAVGDRIVKVGPIPSGEARTTIDAAGHVVAPGFVDAHNHSDGWLIKFDNFASKTCQGYTTEILMSDGISYAPVTRENAHEWIIYLRSLNGLTLADYDDWLSMADYMTRLDRRSAQNSLLQIPLANVRVAACGWGRHPADDTQLKIMRRTIRDSMEAGAAGVSTGLDYVAQCFMSTNEIVESVEASSARDGIYVTHMRYKKGLFPAMTEAVEIARRANVKLHISHLKCEHPEHGPEILAFLERARREVDITFDVYPYGPGSTMLNSLLPYEAWEHGPLGVAAALGRPEVRERFAQLLEDYRLPLDRIHIAWTLSKENSQYHGLKLNEYIEHVGKPAADALADLLIEEQLAVLLVFNQGEDDIVEPLINDPGYIGGTDGIYQPGGIIHPRQFGSSARLLGPWVRDRKVMPLEKAVRALSGLAAERFGLKDRGHVREGEFADLVVFDPRTIGDRATFEDPQQRSRGIPYVFVNGQTVVHDALPVEKFDGKPPGRALAYKR